MKKENNSTSTLLPCQFCGSSSVSYTYDPDCTRDYLGREWTYQVTCNVCCATTGLCYTKEMARNAWNRRTTIHE